ncbi:type II toxin-antitoxin system VapC family toxin [Ideonella sp.]|uniref:type II toxin-antitoxin system VapC family toxin n=1 Tax=Ideonella sp. TaxID=1929293 RepID=UPI0037C024A9
MTIDASALLAVCMNEPSKPRLVSMTIGANLIAPPSVHWEIGNALSAMLKRQRIQPEQAQACISAYQGIPIRWQEVSLDKALVLAGRLNMYAYDAYLLACAEATRSPLLTLDAALNRAAREMGILTPGDDT